MAGLRWNDQDTPFEKDLAASEEAIREAARIAADKASNLVGSAERAIVGGIGGLASGVTNYFTGQGSGLLTPNAAASAVKPPMSAVASHLPPAVQPSIVTPTTGGLGKPTEKTPDLSQFGAGGLRSPVKAEPPPESPFYDRTNPTANGGYTLTPKDQPPALGVTPPVRDYNAEIDTLVSQLMNDPNSRKTQAMSGGVIKTGGINKDVLNTVAALRGHQLGLQGQRENAAAGITGHQITAEATKVGHKATAEAAMDWRTASLEERKRQNDILAQQHTLALQDRQDAAGLKTMESVLNRFAVHESDPMNPTDKAVNMRSTYFNVWDSGTKPHPAIADAVNQMGDQYKAYKENVIKLSKLKDLTPEQEGQVKARFRKTLSLFPDIAPTK